MNASYLEKFIDNTFNLSYKDTTHSFSSKSETFIKTFFSHLCEANKSFKHVQSKLCIFDTVLDYKGENYNHIPKKIQTIFLNHSVYSLLKILNPNYGRFHE